MTSGAGAVTKLNVAKWMIGQCGYQNFQNKSRLSGGGRDRRDDRGPDRARRPGDRVQARIHCHVPLTGPVLGEGLTRTSWEDGLRAAAEAGCMDFEVETYTLPFLPDSWKEPGGVVDTLEGEIRAASRCLNLDSPTSGN